MTGHYHHEEFTAAERDVLSRYVTNVDGPVFALVNLPETVKGALFARYSRTHKSLRRLLLDEFASDLPDAEPFDTHATDKADALYRRVFDEYGDDSVAQLGTCHLACEQSSNILTKILERSRLMSYLEQSTRYIDYGERRDDGRYRYYTDSTLAADPHYATETDALFDAYRSITEKVTAHLEAKHPRDPGDPEALWKRTIRAKAFDNTRSLLPAGTVSNLGIVGSGQSYEALILRMLAHPLPEARYYAQLMLTELRKVIPAFLTRVDVPERGGLWQDYLASRWDTMRSLAADAPGTPSTGTSVTLVDYTVNGELAVAAAALYPYTDLSEAALYAAVESGAVDAVDTIAAYAGDRSHNRRHKPGRAFEASRYRFDITADYGAFRDLQRHRMLTVDWQALTPHLGYDTPPAVTEAGLTDEYADAMARAADLWQHLNDAHGSDVAQYAVPLGYNIRFYLDLNAREAVHLCELRSGPQGHWTYRTVAQQMAQAITEVHSAIGAAMTHVSHDDVDLERLEAERRNEQKRQQRNRQG